MLQALQQCAWQSLLGLEFLDRCEPDKNEARRHSLRKGVNWPEKNQRGVMEVFTFVSRFPLVSLWQNIKSFRALWRV